MMARVTYTTRAGELREGWTRQQCFNCSGHGQVSSYSFGGGDFEGPEECDCCNGSGYIWKSPKGALAQYPGGKFIGREKATAS